MVLVFGIFVGATNALKDKKFMSKLIEEPWGYVQGMLECGGWGAPTKACKDMPMSGNRPISLDPRQ